MKQIKHIYILIIGFFWFLPIELIGTLRLGELLCLFYNILNPIKLINSIASNSALKKFTILWLLTFILIIVSNYINGSNFINTAKGIANYIFIISSFVFFVVFFSNNIKLIIPYLLGRAIGTIFYSPFLLGDRVLGDNFFDVVVAPVLKPSLYLFTIIFSSFEAFTLLVSILSGIILIALNASSSGGTIILGILIKAISFIKTKFKFRTLLFIIISAGIISLLITLFTLSKNKSIDDPWVTKEKNSLLIFFYKIHRIEPIIAAVAILDRPFLGHGSHAKTTYYVNWGIKNRILQKSLLSNFDDIPAHSVLLTSMVEGGIAAGILWLFIGWYLLKSIPILLYSVSNTYNTCALLMVSDAFWNLLFSPLGYARFDLPIVFAFILVLIRKRSVGLYPVHDQIL